MTKKRQKKYDEIRTAMKECGIEIWGYLILDIDIIASCFSFNTTSKLLKNIIKDMPVKLRKCENGTEYLIVSKNE